MIIYTSHVTSYQFVNNSPEIHLQFNGGRSVVRFRVQPSVHIERVFLCCSFLLNFNLTKKQSGFITGYEYNKMKHYIIALNFKAQVAQLVEHLTANHTTTTGTLVDPQSERCLSGKLLYLG